MAEASDRDLVLRTRSGEADAFGEIVHRYQASVFNVCYRLMGERREAEDQAQEAFLRAYQRLGSYDVDRPFGPWVRQVAARVCLNRLESSGPDRLPLDEEADWAADPELSPEAQVRRREQRHSIHRALLGLPPRQRMVIELRHYQELSYGEIAAAMGIPLSDVKSHLFRGRKALAQRIQDADRS